MVNYELVCEGTSYYKTAAETYFTTRLKSKIKDIFEKLIKNKSNLNVLDIGCYVGTDIFMLGLNKNKINFYGVDVSANAIKKN